VFSHEKAKRELGYNPSPLENTIRDTLNWLIEFFKINNNPVFNLKDSSI
jgi:nucleoside-diphosphate-sugar epimerase